MVSDCLRIVPERIAEPLLFQILILNEEIKKSNSDEN
jgi:hypothetical protein